MERSCLAILVRILPSPSWTLGPRAGFCFQFSRCLYLEAPVQCSGLIMKLTGKMLQISSVGVDRHAMVSGQHLITASIWCLNTVLWLVRRAILGSDWLICCNDDGHQSMPRVRSVRISKNMIITLSTGLGIHSDREDGKIWNVQTKNNKKMKFPVALIFLIKLTAQNTFFK